ncbi:MAG TPA: SycD/LcrH family type III secretion system chaperone [Ramlibacter sp.]|uniref:SycD/LcrH family type III secretion system chaperone n=1 Tax=Ramlibacter sp. TaxID=1917967 RepID=UPI002BF00942|nr:SycD/LcrH family type III secretion system chaperone [Ramlibacter sp.]HVZ45025.1 SycD/LcrH family type III secretion system chaperone [Ramlibacter sp.]
MSAVLTSMPATVEEGFALLERMCAGQTLADAMGQSRESLESIYQLGYTFYNQGKYMEAMRVFAYLLAANHMDPRHHIGFGACMQMQKHYGEALRFYAAASKLDPTQPEPALYMAECHLALGKRGEARTAIQFALMRSRAGAAHGSLVPRLEAMLAFLDANPEAAPSDSNSAAPPPAAATTQEKVA